MNIPITKTVFDESEFQIVQEPLKSGWIVQGPYVRKFEKLFSEFTASPYALATTSCTTALHIALVALGIGPGDEVIVPAFTWVATASVVEYVGAKPIFCDISLDTYNIDTLKINELITPRTKAIIPVHLFGLPADMDAIMAIANRHNLRVIEDAACGFGAYYEGKHVGTFGDAGCFSFHPRKAITTGEGGMILTGNSALYDYAIILRDHGASRNDLSRHNSRYGFLLADFNHLGFNYRMTDIQAAIGVEQMHKAGYILEKRAMRAEKYNLLLSDMPWLIPPVTPEACRHGYQSYVCLFAPEKPTMQNVERLSQLRNDIMARLELKGIATRQGTHAVTTLGFYQQKYGIRCEDFPAAFMADRLSVTLPLYAQMTDIEQDFVVSQLAEAYGRLCVE